MRRPNSLSPAVPPVPVTVTVYTPHGIWVKMTVVAPFCASWVSANVDSEMAGRTATTSFG